MAVAPAIGHRPPGRRVPSPLAMATSALEPLSVSVRALLRSPRAPLVALAVISVLSLGARGLQARGTVLGAVYQRQRPHVDLRRGLLRQRGQGDRGHPSSVRIALRRLTVGIRPQRRAPAGSQADHRGRDRAVRRRPVRVADRQPDLRIARDPRDVLPRALGRWRPVAGGRRRGADRLRQPAAGPLSDRHARHLCAGADDLGRRLIPPRAVGIGGRRPGDRRLYEGGRAVRADRARADRAGAGADRLARSRRAGGVVLVAGAGALVCVLDPQRRPVHRGARADGAGRAAVRRRRRQVHHRRANRRACATSSSTPPS